MLVPTMTMSANQTRAPGLATLALMTLGLASMHVRTCDARDRDSAPALAMGPDRYTVAWMRPARTGGSIHVQPFDPQSLKSLGASSTIVKRADLVAGGLELVAVGDGYLAIGRIEDPEQRPRWATHLLLVPLDARGQVVGESSVYGVDRPCHGAGVVGPYVLIPYILVGRSHRFPEDYVGVLAVDRDGNFRGQWLVGPNAIQCASADKPA